MKNSSLSSFFDNSFISYFCDELYSERNPILHGIQIDTFNKLNAAKKILTLDYLIGVIDNFIFEHYKNDMNEIISDAIFEKVINQENLSDEENESIKLIAQRILERRHN